MTVPHGTSAMECRSSARRRKAGGLQAIPPIRSGSALSAVVDPLPARATARSAAPRQRCSGEGKYGEGPGGPGGEVDRLLCRSRSTDGSRSIRRWARRTRSHRIVGVNHGVFTTDVEAHAEEDLHAHESHGRRRRSTENAGDARLEADEVPRRSPCPARATRAITSRFQSLSGGFRAEQPRRRRDRGGVQQRRVTDIRSPGQLELVRSFLKSDAAPSALKARIDQLMKVSGRWRRRRTRSTRSRRTDRGGADPHRRDQESARDAEVGQERLRARGDAREEARGAGRARSRSVVELVQDPERLAVAGRAQTVVADTSFRGRAAGSARTR